MSGVLSDEGIWVLNKKPTYIFLDSMKVLMIAADHVKMLLLHFSTVFICWKGAKLAQVCQQVELRLHCQMCASVGLSHISRSFQTEASSFPNILWHLKTLFLYQCL